MDVLVAIRKSMVVFFCGLLGLIPVLGVFPAACALSSGVSLQFRLRREGNPAALYLRWGTALGLFGLCMTCLGVVVIGMALYQWGPPPCYLSQENSSFLE
jgi:hypothetical protein